MYLQGSSFSNTRRRTRRKANPFRILMLVILVGAGIYVNQVVVPATPPLFIPTATPTRSPESFITEGEYHLAQGRISQAISSYRSAVDSDPRNPANYITMARLLIFTAKYEEAVTAAENALLLSPNNSTAHALRGWGYALAGDYLQAEGALQRALEIDPDNAVAHANLAESIALKVQNGQGDIGSLDQAVDLSRRAMELGAGLLETHRARGLVLEVTGNYEEAAREFEAAIAINPNIADQHLALGRVYRILQQYNNAVEQFNLASGLNPTDPMPLTHIARTYATVGEFAKAIQYAQQAVKVRPDDPFLYGNLGVMLYRNQHHADALPVLRLAVRGGKSEEGVDVAGLPLNYGRVAEYYFTYALALARAAECGEALQISQALSRGVPNDEIAIYNANQVVEICSEFAGSPLPTFTPATKNED